MQVFVARYRFRFQVQWLLIVVTSRRTMRHKSTARGEQVSRLASLSPMLTAARPRFDQSDPRAEKRQRRVQS